MVVPFVVLLAKKGKLLDKRYRRSVVTVFCSYKLRFFTVVCIIIPSETLTVKNLILSSLLYSFLKQMKLCINVFYLSSFGLMKSEQKINYNKRNTTKDKVKQKKYH